MSVEVTSVTTRCVYVVRVGSDDLFALRGEVPSVAVGDALVVKGAPDDTPYAACPDGVPFLVSTVSRS